MGSPGWSLVFLMLLTITGVPFATIYRGVYLFLSALVLVALLLLIFPELATFLPNPLMP